MQYRVILTKNGQYKKTLYKSEERGSCFINYRILKEENENIIFERKYINYNGIIPVKYKIYIVKDYEETDKKRMVKNDKGELVPEEPLFGKWTVLETAPYKHEENFWLFGYCQKTERKEIKDILKILMIGVSKTRFTKEIIVVHNKLVIYNEEQFDMVICKCKKDAQRLHHMLARAAADNKIKNLLFMGTATNATVSHLYEIIHEETGWPYEKIRRTTTRP